MMIQYLDIKVSNNHSLEVAFTKDSENDIELDSVEVLYNGRYRRVNKLLTDRHIDSLVQYLGENA